MDDEDWKTPEIREAEARLEEAIAGAERQLAAAEALEADQQDGSRGLDPEQIQRIEQLVRRGQAPPEIAELQQAIDAGDLTWDDVVQRRKLDHEAVQNALAAGVPAMTRIKELHDEGYDLPTILAADPNRFDPARDPYDDDEPPESFMDQGPR